MTQCVQPSLVYSALFIVLRIVCSLDGTSRVSLFIILLLLNLLLFLLQLLSTYAMTLCLYFDYILKCELLLFDLILSFILSGSMYMFCIKLIKQG
jgi:hypothetical protein